MTKTRSTCTNEALDLENMGNRWNV